LSGRLAGVSVLTTPSTGVQFRPGTEVLECDSLAPGFRVLELFDEGTVQSRVVRF
jgi:Icc protein